MDLSLQLLARHPSPKWIGLGGIVPLLQRRAVKGLVTFPEVFIAQAIRLIRDAFPSSKLHVFGAGGPRTFPAVFAFRSRIRETQLDGAKQPDTGSIFLPFKNTTDGRMESLTKDLLEGYWMRRTRLKSLAANAQYVQHYQRRVASTRLVHTFYTRWNSAQCLDATLSVACVAFVTQETVGVDCRRSSRR